MSYDPNSGGFKYIQTLEDQLVEGASEWPGPRLFRMKRGERTYERAFVGWGGSGASELAFALQH